jgi:hypothetical protein
MVMVKNIFLCQHKFYFFPIRNMYIRFNFMRIANNRWPKCKWFNGIQSQVGYLITIYFIQVVYWNLT